MLVTFKSYLGSKVKLRVTVILSFQNKVFQLTHLFYLTMLFILFTELSYPSHLRLAVLKPMALLYSCSLGLNYRVLLSSECVCVFCACVHVCVCACMRA